MGSTTSFRATPTTTTSLSILFKPHSLIPSNFKFKPFSSFKPLKPITSSRPNTPPIPESFNDDATAITAAAAAADSTIGASPQNLKSRLRNGETLYGLFLLSFSPTLAEIAGVAAYDFVVVDMEHGHGGISDALPCLHALAAEGPRPGPAGDHVPHDRVRQIRQEGGVVLPVPAAGVRGSAHPVVRASGYGIDEGYLGSYHEELLIICQVESEEGVKKADEIAAVDGVDCVQMGPLDLSASMGYLWDPGIKKVREMMREAEKKVLESMDKNKDKHNVGVGAYLSGFALPHDGPKDLKSRGDNMVSGAVDAGLFRSAAVEDVRSFKMSLIEEGSDNEQGEGKDGDEKYWSE